ncbi:dipeptidase [Parahaliea mediterranea]|uniref:Dipeptidase n=1 Tax=Parahaliea mediterranea TaxID=651086 RepID=A0A939DCR1_9GAMM|nr:dipeptidase [Parahaliea mediterranea]MBN7795670.1 dipeptidase [Parahaliea mediterranea]
MPIRPRALAGALALSLLASPHGHADRVQERAGELARKYLLVDTHIDVPYRIHKHWEDVTRATEKGEFDYPRAVAGGLNVPFMSIYTPASSESDGSAYALANTLIDHVEAMVARAPDKFAIATSPVEVEKQFKAGKISLALGMENGAPIAGDLDKLRHFHRRGVRYVTLAHGESNHISDSSYDDVRLWRGLSPFGAEVVSEMNELGIMVDISHLSDAAAFEVLERSSAPVIASHSSMRKFTPGFERNMDDKLLRALANKGGVVMINFGSSFVTAKANQYFENYSTARETYAKRHALAWGSEEMQAFEQRYRDKQPLPFATVSEVADHIDHVVNTAGIDHVGIGSDYDGVGDSLPIGLKDVSTYPNLVAELLRRDYSEGDIEKLLGANLMRVWRAVAARAE